MLQPIWKDYFLTVSEPQLQALNYELHEGTALGPTLYTGRAYRRPNEDDFRIKLNEVVADYLRSELPVLEDRTITIDRTTLDVVPVYMNGSGIAVELPPITFVNDWSYDYLADPETVGLADPIVAEIQANHFWMFSHLAGLSGLQLEKVDGTTERLIIFFSNAGTYCLTVAPDVKRIIADGVLSYDVVPVCNRFTLYYENARGGWDFLTIKGNHNETDELTRHEYEREYDNSVPSHRGKSNYVNEIAKRYSLNTGWMSDEQAARMYNLGNSTNVYMWDNERQAMYPVILKNSTTEYKTFKTEGRLVNYTLEVEIAQTLQRR